MFYLPTKEECDRIVNSNTAFYRTCHEIEGYNVVVYNYRLAEYMDFVKPLKGEDIQAFELRGLTFVEQPDGSWRRFLGLHKFFNLNQTKGYMYDDVKDKRMVRVSDKMDGSMIRFIQLPNGHVVTKTKMGFTNIQVEEAERFLDVGNYIFLEFIMDMLEQGKAAIFEYTSPTNRIVVDYDRPRLSLLQIRDENTGEYLDIEKECEDYFDVVHDYPLDDRDLDGLIDVCKWVENKEGFVVQFDDGQMIKLKSEWYMRLHRLMTNTADHENVLLECILNETIDDILAEMDEKNPVRQYIEAVMSELVPWVNNQVKNIENLRLLYDYEFRGTQRKKFVDYLISSNCTEFHHVMKLLKWPMEEIEEKDLVFEVYKAFLLKTYNKKEKAAKFLKEVVGIKANKYDYLKFTIDSEDN